MTVKELIEKLQSLNPDIEVIIEENNGECYPVREEEISEEVSNKNYYNTSEEELDNCLNVVVIRA